jgi:prepilin-type N-terminal cleavage/methylation domain-containing protein
MKFEFRILNKTKNAFSLVEVLIVIFIMSVTFVAFYTVSAIGIKYIVESKNRLVAAALLNERMEIVRNLAYDDIALQNGIPAGNIPQIDDVVTNGKSFHIVTSVDYQDDPYDGLAVDDADLIPNDYKIVKVIVSWDDSNGQSQSVVSVSRFVPPGLETDAGGAPLAINVTDSSGNGVLEPSIHIENNSISPTVSTTKVAGIDGHILMPSASASVGGYHFTITKNGYETVETMDATPTFIPRYPHASVIMGSMNLYAYEQNKLADLTIKTEDIQGNPVGNIRFSMEGGKRIGRDNEGNDVYNMSNTDGNELFGLGSATAETDSTNGKKEYPDISPGNYKITMEPHAQFEFIDFDPSQTPANLMPGSDLTYVMKVADKNIDSLFLNITNSEGNPIAGAQVRMVDGSGAEVFSGETSSARGVVFYPNGETPLASGTYNLEIQTAGYETQNDSITISGLTKKNIVLTES